MTIYRCLHIEVGRVWKRVIFSLLHMTKLFYICFVFIFTTTFLHPQTTHARTNASILYVATHGSDSAGCGSSSQPCKNIAHAINLSQNDDEIRIASGTHVYSGISDACGFLSQKSVICVSNKRLVIRGGYSPDWSTNDPQTFPTLIDGQNAYRGLTFIGNRTSDIRLTLENVTIQNGKSQGPHTPGNLDAFGGGMWMTEGVATIRNVVFKQNEVIGASGDIGGSGSGGGFAIISGVTGAATVLENTRFEDNTSRGGTGNTRGGLAFGAAFIYNAQVEIRDSVFTNNKALGGNSSGSGIGNGLPADALGGAIGIEASAVVIYNVSASGNQAIGGSAGTSGGGFGGAVFIEDSPRVDISQSKFSQNLASGGPGGNGTIGAGGGLLTFNSTVHIGNSQFIANRAVGGNNAFGSGGGIALWSVRNGSSPSSLTNVIISDNIAERGPGNNNGALGGGIQVQGLIANLDHCTIANNRLNTVNGIGTGVMVAPHPNSGPTTANINFSLITDHNANSTISAVGGQQGVTINLNKGLFANNSSNTNASQAGGVFNGEATMFSATTASYVSAGAPSYDYHLQSSSAAVDAATGSALKLDIDNHNRPFGAANDIGADEYFFIDLSRLKEKVYLPFTRR
jgi:hypothetical protein